VSVAIVRKKMRVTRKRANKVRTGGKDVGREKTRERKIIWVKKTLNISKHIADVWGERKKEGRRPPHTPTHKKKKKTETQQPHRGPSQVVHEGTLMVHLL